MNVKEVKNLIKSDYEYIVGWSGGEWSDEHEKELKRLIEVNTDRYIEHLEKYGEISHFQYK